jgi:protein TonB
MVLSAQAPGPGLLTGYAYDSTGAVLPAVEVTLTAGQQAPRSAVSDGSGRFQFPGVGAGTYVLEARQPGFRPLRSELALQAPRDWTRNITMQVSEIEETVMVTARRPAQAVPLPQAASRTNPVRVGGVVRQPGKLKDVPPLYPAAMRDAGLEGVVPMEALIRQDGSVASVRTLSAAVHPSFARAAEDAVRQWVFTPTTLNGQPVEVQMTVSVRFSLED